MLHAILTIWLASCTADAVATHRGLSTGLMVESDPLMPQHKWAIDAALGAQALGGVTLLVAAPHRRTLVYALLIAGSVLHTYAAIHNTQVRTQVLMEAGR